VNSLLLLFFAIIFLHALIRLHQLARAARRRNRRLARKAALAAGGLDASPDASQGRSRSTAPYFDDPEIGLPPPGEPIRVVLARDEELGLTDDVMQAEVRAAVAAGGEGRVVGDRVARPPPVYGVWRGSVVRS